jgi:Protein of unknown function (DUF3237)
MIQPGIEFTYEATAVLGTPISIGSTADGTRRIVAILEGRVEGPLLRGELIGGGADIRNRGLRHGSPEIMAALEGGEAVEPSSYYFRAVPEFIAPVGRYEWLNRWIFVCTGARYPRAIKLWVWRVT